VVFFCPQLYKHDHDSKLVPLQGEAIGRFVAQAMHNRTAMRRPWYEPTDSIPAEPFVLVLAKRRRELDRFFVTFVCASCSPRP